MSTRYRTFCTPTYPRVVRMCACLSSLLPLFEWGPDQKAKAEAGARARGPAICMYQNHRLQRSSTVCRICLRPEETIHTPPLEQQLPTLSSNFHMFYLRSAKWLDRWEQQLSLLSSRGERVLTSAASSSSTSAACCSYCTSRWLFSLQREKLFIFKKVILWFNIIYYFIILSC